MRLFTFHLPPFHVSKMFTAILIPSAVHRNESKLFVTTFRKTVFDAGQPENIAARELLVNRYRFPLYAFARRSGLSVEDGADAIQTL
jgi:hypothetical protein